MYTTTNFKSKKALKEAVKAYNRLMELIPNYGEDGCMLTVGAVLAQKEFPNGMPQPVDTFQPGDIYPAKKDGRIALEGPHFPAPHSWHAEAVIKNGIVRSVK